MGQFTNTTAADGHKLAVYLARPAGAPRGGLVVIQEIFGMNRHMRHVCDEFAAQGYLAAGPALFDRVRPGIELGYAEADVKAGREYRAKIAWPQVLADVRATLGLLKEAGKAGIVGYCWGGSVAWRGATQVEGFRAAVSYYGGQVAEFAHETPRCPVQFHFGEKDQSIPLADVDKVRAAQKGAAVEFFTYPAGHGFSCDERGSYDADSTRLAQTRTLAFLKQHIG